VLLRILWFLAIGMLLSFLYRLVMSTIRYLAGEKDSRQQEQQPPGSQPSSKQNPVDFRDVKDAQFKDLPPGPDDRA
jgi:uncharacterized membrane protein